MYESYQNRILACEVNDLAGLNEVLDAATVDNTLEYKDFRKLVDLAARKGWNTNYKPNTEKS